MHFETDIVSEIRALEFHLTAPGFAVLVLDDRGSPSEVSIAKPPQSMLSHWAVSHHLFASRMSAECMSSNSIMPSSFESRIWIFYSIKMVKCNRQRL